MNNMEPLKLNLEMSIPYFSRLSPKVYAMQALNTNQSPLQTIGFRVIIHPLDPVNSQRTKLFCSLMLEQSFMSRLQCVNRILRGYNTRHAYLVGT